VASWLIYDHAFQRRYPFGMSEPFPVPVWPYVRSGYLKRGRPLDELARARGIDPAGLAATVESVKSTPPWGRTRSSGGAGRRSTAGRAIRSTAPTRRSHPSSLAGRHAAGL
jgi:hypothetical protein